MGDGTRFSLKLQLLLGGMAGFTAGVIVCVIMTLNGGPESVALAILGLGFLELIGGFAGSCYVSTRAQSTTLGHASPLPIRVSTSDLLAYVGTIISWELSVVLWFAKLKLRGQNGVNVAYFTLVVVAICLSLYVTIRAKKTFHALRHTRGRIALSGFQVLLTSTIVLSLSIFLVWVLAAIFGLR